MSKLTVAVLGATGLIGEQLLKLLQEDSDYEKIKVIARRPVPNDHSKIETMVIDFTNETQFENALAGSDIIFSAIGTTMKNVGGNKDLYRSIDYDIPVHAARYGAESGCQYFGLVSSVGADTKSSNFYLQLKGKVEETIQEMNIVSIGIFRPSMLLGNRQEFRLGEKIGKIIMATFSFLIPANYKAIQANDVAKAMLQAAKSPGKKEIFHYKQILQLARDYDRKR